MNSLYRSEPIKPRTMWVFFTYSGNPIAWAIDCITGSNGWAHCGVGFDLNNGKSVYYEAHWRTGFSGPKVRSNLFTWAAAKPRRKLYFCHINSLTIGQVDVAYERAKAMAGKNLAYGKLQVLVKWVVFAFGWRLPHSPKRADCSESTSRILEGLIDIAVNKTHDEVSPNDVYTELVTKGKAD